MAGGSRPVHRGVVIRLSDVEQFERACETFLPGRAGERAVMPDAMEAARQDMEQEAAEELAGGR